MDIDFKVDKKELEILYAYTKGAYKGLTFEQWSKECEKSYMSYFNNKELFNIRKYTYSQFVSSQIIALQI